MTESLPLNGRPDLYLWDDCKRGRHENCGHVGTYGSLTFRGMKHGFTRCTCPCHQSCPVAQVDLAGIRVDDGSVDGACTCESD